MRSLHLFALLALLAAPPAHAGGRGFVDRLRARIARPFKARSGGAPVTTIVSTPAAKMKAHLAVTGGAVARLRELAARTRPYAQARLQVFDNMNNRFHGATVTGKEARDAGMAVAELLEGVTAVVEPLRDAARYARANGQPVHEIVQQIDEARAATDHVIGPIVRYHAMGIGLTDRLSTGYGAVRDARDALADLKSSLETGGPL
jgi:hypothetical protein